MSLATVQDRVRVAPHLDRHLSGWFLDTAGLYVHVPPEKGRKICQTSTIIDKLHLSYRQLLWTGPWLLTKQQTYPVTMASPADAKKLISGKQFDLLAHLGRQMFSGVPRLLRHLD